MNVLYFHQHFSTPSGSTGIRSYEMARRLVAGGHKVTMVCGSFAGGQTGLVGRFKRGRRTGIVDDIEIIEFDLSYSNSDGFLSRSVTFLRYALRSIGLALRYRYDLLFATSTPLTAGIPGIAARWLRHKTFVFEVRDLWPELPREMGVITNPVVLWAMGVLEWLSYRSAHRLVGLSPGIVQGIARRGVAIEKIALIPNGCDMGIFSASDGARSNGPAADHAWRPDGVRDDDFMAIFAGTHGMANGLDAVLDTALVLKNRGRDDIKIVLVGSGKLKTTLVARGKSQGLGNVMFLDPVNKARLAGLMARTDLGLQILANVPAFYYGTSPNKFFDYIAAGVPVLSNYPGWLAELIQKHQCGFIVPPEDSEAFADALVHAAGDRDILATMGRNAQALAREEFDRDKLAERFVRWLEDACG